MHNLRTVLQFEVVRTLKKKTFWAAALAVPLIVGFIGGVIYFSNTATGERSKEIASEQFSIGMTDMSHTVSTTLAWSLNIQEITTEQAGQAAVQSGELDAYYYYPANVSEETVRVYGKNVGLFENSRYQDLASQLLSQSAASTVDASLRTILQDDVTFATTIYDEKGNIDKGFMKLIAPGIFLVLFYFMIATFGNQILTSITEEKENRVIEMILTTIKPTTLLVGKLISLIILAFIQMFVILIPVVAGYLIFKDQLSLPNFDLTAIPLDPLAIGIGATIFMVSFLMFTSILMALGAAMPTAKEAGSFFGAVLALVFGPLYAAPLFVTSPDLGIVQFLSYFPLTSPIPLLLRNAVGNLPLGEALVAISLLVLTTIIVVNVGVRIFRFGALEYSRKLSIKEVIGRKS